MISVTFRPNAMTMNDGHDHANTCTTSPDRRITDPGRRRVLAAGALGLGASALVAACSGSNAVKEATGKSGTVAAKAPTTGAPASPATVDANSLALFSDQSMNFECLFAFGEACYGTAEVGEVVAAVSTINAAGPTYGTYTETFLALADKLAGMADQAKQRGDMATERACSFRAATYYTQALYFVLGSDQPDREEAIYRSNRASYDRAVGLLDVPPVTLEVPYGTTPMPAWLFRPADDGRARPTVIINNGSDAQSVELWAYGTAAALERGWNALVFEGPGQGQLLFVDKVSFTPRWETVITPIVDLLSKREDVDDKKIALTGWSMGGTLVARAASREHRLAALVMDPGDTDAWLAFPEVLREMVQPTADGTNQAWANDVLPSLSPEQNFTLKKRLEIFTPDALESARRGGFTKDFAAVVDAIKAMTCTDVLKDITTPTLVLDYDGEQFYQGQPQKTFELLTAPKDFYNFSADVGAQFHCAPMAPQHRNEVVFDWLATKLR